MSDVQSRLETVVEEDEEKGSRGKEMAIDIEALKQKLKKMNDKGKGGQKKFKSDLWTPEIGSHFCRPIPWPAGMDIGENAPFVERWFYYGLGKRVVAPGLNQPDPVRELRAELFSDRTDENLAVAKKLKPKMRCFLPVIVIATEDDPDEGVKKGQKIVKLWGLSEMIYKELLAYICDPDYGDFTDTESGFDITLEISDSGKKFDDGTPIKDVKPRLKPRPRKLDEDERKLLSKVPDINGIYPISTYEQLRVALEKFVDGEPSGQQETRGGTKPESEPKAQKPRPAATSRAAALDQAFDGLFGG